METPAKESMLDRFCHSIEAFEGGPNDANHKNNNPGNFRYFKGGYLPKYGHVRCSPGGFAIFPTYELGWEYLLNSVHHRVAVHPKWRIYDFFENYAPKGDGNDPKHYAEVVAQACGVSPYLTLEALFG